MRSSTSMTPWSSAVVCFVALTALLSLTKAAGAQESAPATQAQPGLLYQWWKEAVAPSTRGVAVLSPVDSPDGYAPGVGGRVKSVPYYRGYLWSGSQPSRGASPGGYGFRVPGHGRGAAQAARGARANYGSYSGASQDEAYLLRLGGLGSGANRPRGPGHGPATDLVDAIQGEGRR